MHTGHDWCMQTCVGAVWLVSYVRLSCYWHFWPPETLCNDLSSLNLQELKRSSMQFGVEIGDDVRGALLYLIYVIWFKIYITKTNGIFHMKSWWFHSRICVGPSQCPPPVASLTSLLISDTISFHPSSSRSAPHPKPIFAWWLRQITSFLPCKDQT